PTRAACETIELGVQLTGVETVIQREHGEEIRELARSGKGFGIMAGTGTGKTLAIRPIAQEIVGPELRVGVVNREREATPETPTWNVVIVTTGIARRWLQDDMIDATDVVIVDEIHQTSAELELCLALAKRAGCRFIWLSATVDPTFYARYLDSAAVIESSAFDPDKAAEVRVSNTADPVSFLGERFMRHVQKDRRGVAVFVPTRAGTEQVAKVVEERYRGQILTEFYHGGEPVAKLRPFLEDDGAPHPFVLSMTAAGQSALNIRGLDTVVIEDAQFTTLVKKGKSVLTRMPLGANEILQMVGRVHGRVAGGEVWILSEREFEFSALRPTEPHFQLAGDPERVAMTCADMGVLADELDLPVPLDRIAYRRSVELLQTRGIIANGRLTHYGREVEVLPVDRAWGELLVQADAHLVPIVAVCASIESLHRMLRQQDNDIGQYVVKGSDHLTAYNIYQDALETTGSLGSVYGLPRHVFEPEALEKWCEERGVMMRSIEDAALAIASIFRGLYLELPRTLPRLNGKLDREWRALVSRVMPFSLVIDEETSWGEHVTVSKTSVANSWGAVAGEIVYFADKMGRARGSISGTSIPDEMVWEFSKPGEAEIVYDSSHRRAPLRLRRTKEFHGFVLEAEDEGINRFPEGMEDECRRVLAEAVASGQAYHPDIPRVRETLRELREVFRRSAGTTAPVDEKVLTNHLLARLAEIRSYPEFMETPLRVDPDELVPADERARWMALPDAIWIGDRQYPLDYVLDGDTAVVRARIPAKTLNEVDESELPELDRPLHWTVTRGKHEAVRAATLDEARVLVRETSPATRARARDDEEGGRGGGRGRARGEGGRGRRSGQRKGGGRGGRNGGDDGGSRGSRGGGGGRRKGGGHKGRRKARH
ncbi:MAG TPA: hypothetical protein VFR81_10045, partial [Longimicrobium sp.]|nr:hypothetical protein [Longimicrobium sp.]